MRRFTCLLTATLLVLPRLHAGADSPLDAVEQGLGFFRSVSAEAAMKRWGLAHAVADKNNPSHDAFLRLAQIEREWGARCRSEVISEHQLTASTSRLFLSLLFDKGAAYAAFDLYRSPSGWKVNTIKINQDPDKIVPRHLFIE